MLNQPKLDIQHTDDPTQALQWLEAMGPLVACDFEASSIYTLEEHQEAKEALKEAELNPDANHDKIIKLRKIVNNSGLSHPSQVIITHLSVSDSETSAKVIILGSDETEQAIMNWLTTTKRKQIWHNASFDLKLIFHRTGKFPPDFEDSQQLAKALINHVEVYKAKTSLKELMGHRFGNWAISADNFHFSQAYEPHVVTYSGIDAIATLCLWNDIQSDLKE